MLIVFVNKVSNRFLYSTTLIFNQLLSINISICTDKNDFISAKSPKINYSQARLTKEEYFIPAHTLLFEEAIQQQKIIIDKHSKYISFFSFPTIKNADIDFDILSMVFYLVSRYEEYLPFEADKHDRFTAPNSLAYQADFLHLPLVNLWIIELGKQLKKKFPELEITSPTYKYLASYDIDMAWAYKNKDFSRTIGAGLKDLATGKIDSLQKRWQVLRDKKQDPFYAFQYLKDLHQKQATTAIFFFLLGKYGAHDKNTAPDHPDMQNLIKDIDAHFQVGIHPSYASNDSTTQLEKEISTLRQLTTQKIISSRQHFLKLSFPQTYKQLLVKGVKEDYTMGYATAVGFRASIATSFYWYNLEEDKATSLLIHPFMLMDVTLKSKHYLGLKPQEAIKLSKDLIEQTKAVGGTFMTIWHNSSFSYIDDWEEWQKVYEAIFEAAQGV